MKSIKILQPTNINLSDELYELVKTLDPHVTSLDVSDIIKANYRNMDSELLHRLTWEITLLREKYGEFHF